MTSELAVGIEELELRGRVVCVHSALSSFEQLVGGADAILDALLAADCTVVVPTFTYAFETATPAHAQWRRNGMDYQSAHDARPTADAELKTGYRTEENALSRADMGAIPAAVLARSGRVRGMHPLNSFSAIGPQAETVIAGQSPQDVYAPLRAVVAVDGRIILMGVDETSLTLAHLAEAEAGRALFRRWGWHDGVAVECQVGSCSAGFGQLSAVTAGLSRSAVVAGSSWRVLPAAATLDALTQAIAQQPLLTHCGRDRCLRCRDSVAGGPLLS